MNQTPARSDIIVLKQLLNFIPRGVFNQAARKTGVEKKARTFSVLSHLATMLFAQLSHAISLNDVCDWLRLKAAPLSRLHITPPSRNALSHANKVRSADFIESLFWSVLAHLQNIQPGFATGKKGKGLLRRFKVRIHAVDSTVMELVANCLDWAKHRSRKAAAKMHLRLDLHSFLPSFAIVDTAAHHDNKRAREICAGICAGEIVVFDKAYVDFDHLWDLDQRGVWWVSRAKENMAYRVEKNLSLGVKGIFKDELIALTGPEHEGMMLRRVEAYVEIEGEERLMVFITNNLAWSPRTVCDLYKRRWDIEAFFKQVKQTLRLSNFLGHNANAVRWQVYTALLVYVLLRFQAFLSDWAHSFTRLFAVVRSAVWERLNLLELLKSYGTASGRIRFAGALNHAWQQLWLPDLAPPKA
ncbi:MAG: IS4 family transposase [Verrucomicrobiota bacterium]